MCEWLFSQIDEVIYRVLKSMKTSRRSREDFHALKHPVNYRVNLGKQPRTLGKRFLTKNQENYSNRLLFLMIMLFLLKCAYFC